MFSNRLGLVRLGYLPTFKIIGEKNSNAKIVFDIRFSYFVVIQKPITIGN